MNEESRGTGCRGAAIGTGLLLGFAIVFMIVGLGLANRGSCVDLCETAGLTLLYAGGPISGLLGVFFGGLWVAWPLEITLWVVVGFLAARWAEPRRRSVAGVAVVIVSVALIYGLVLSQLVEIAV